MTYQHEAHDDRPLKDRIRDYIVKTDHVSFAELAQRFPIGGGELCMELAPNLFLWYGMNAEAVAAIKELIDDKIVYMHPTTTLVYMIDGMVPGAPVAKRKPRYGYGKPHWAPMTLSPKPYVRKRARG